MHCKNAILLWLVSARVRPNNNFVSQHSDGSTPEMKQTSRKYNTVY